MIDDTPDVSTSHTRAGPIRVWRNHNGRGWRWAIDTDDDGLGGHYTHGRCESREAAERTALARYVERERDRRSSRGR